MIDSQIAGIKKHNFDLLITHVSNYACFVNMLRASLVLIIIIMINIYRQNSRTQCIHVGFRRVK